LIQTLWGVLLCRLMASQYAPPERRYFASAKYAAFLYGIPAIKKMQRSPHLYSE
jgi:hypothetical protein